MSLVKDKPTLPDVKVTSYSLIIKLFWVRSVSLASQSLFCVLHIGLVTPWVTKKSLGTNTVVTTLVSILYTPSSPEVPSLRVYQRHSEVIGPGPLDVVVVVVVEDEDVLVVVVVTSQSISPVKSQFGVAQEYISTEPQV